MYTSSSTSAGKKKTVKKVVLEVPQENKTTTEVVVGTGGPKTGPFSSSVKGNNGGLNRVKTGFVAKKPSVKTTLDKFIQTDHPDTALITGDSHPPEYWKLLAESRLQQLETAQQRILELENEKDDLEVEVKKLKDMNDLLKNENETLESMLEGAKEMAEYFQALPDSSDGAESE